MHDELKELGERWGLQTVLAVVGLIDQTLVRIRFSVYARALLEATLIQICSLPDLQNISDLASAASAVARGEKKKLTDSPVSQREPAATTAESDPPESALVDETPAKVIPSPAPAAESTPSGSDTERKNSSVASPAATDQTLTKASAENIWHQAAEEVEPMTATLANLVQRVELPAEDRLRLVFPADSKMSIRRIDLPEHKNALCSAVARLSGRSVHLEFVAAPAAASTRKPPPRPTGKDRIQRMREIEGNPLVQACVELFDAEIVQVDYPPSGER
jgi:DNA polymerase-3 subunit gamma/tau